MRLIPQPTSFAAMSGICLHPDNINEIRTSVIEGEEAYHLTVEKNAVTIRANSDKGFFYGRKTLEMLKIQSEGKLFCCSVHDAPRFAYRGFMIDSARHMQSVAELKKLIDLAALLKFNVFHWHLSDDQGFRIELDSLPLLTEKGSVRKCDGFGKLCRSDKEYGGYYTKEEIRDIVAYCADRYIEVIPETDLPGHFSSVLHVYPELSCTGNEVEIKTRQGVYKDILCAGNEGTMPFLRKLFDEMCELFPGRYYHIGGDEAPKDNWNACPRCQAEIKKHGLKNADELQVYLCSQAAEYLKTKGKKTIVWNDILKGGTLPEGVMVQKWMDPKKLSANAAENGTQLIASDFDPFYLDYPYGQYPLKRVYDFAPAGKKYSEKAKLNIIGTETPVWTEFIPDDAKLEYQIIPRWFAVAENAWSAQDKKDYGAFRESCLKLTQYLAAKGYNYAPENKWDMNLLKRAAECLRFYKDFIAK